MARRAVVGGMLLVALLVGVAYQPDVGTAADLNSAGVTDISVGTNHAKPLPRVVTVADILESPAVALLALMLLAAVGTTVAVHASREQDSRHRSVFRSPVPARRGPPALAVG